MEKVTVTADALYRVLMALNGPDYYIRELQATRGFDRVFGEKGVKQNPINILLDEYNAAVEVYNKQQQETEMNEPKLNSEVE